jgi:CDP-diacylglycerol--serine O-phosphatidyltransferase
MNHRPKREGIRKGIYLLPNLITTGSLFCGFLSIIHAIKGHYFFAGWMILLAGIFDLFDGRVARLTRTHSDFGIEYDSLCDLASFGLAPAILVYTWAIHDFKQIGAAAAFLFFVCAALRLARFNVQVSDVEKKHFQGLPVPMAAYTLSSFVILNHSSGNALDPVLKFLLLALTVGLALLMVSTVPYRNFKKINFKRRQSFFVLVLLAVLLGVVTSAPREMIFIISFLYVTLGLIENALQLTQRQKTGLASLLEPEEEKKISDPSLRLVKNNPRS